MWRHLKKQRKLLNNLLLISLVTSCQTFVQESLHESVARPHQKDRFLKIPPGMIPVGRIVVDHAVVREGPFRHMPIGEKFLSRNEEVIIRNTHGKWWKVFGVSSQAIGWVHQEMITKPWLNKETLTIPEKALQKIYTKSRVYQPKAFYDVKLGFTKMPKGEALMVLNNWHEEVLVWNPKRKVILWIGKTSVDL